MSDMINHTNFSASDIEKYWKGELSPAAMYALEKAAMEDPFLGDALEGYGERSRESGVGSVEKDIKELEQRLEERVADKKKRFTLGGQWWKVAAVLIVVAGGVWLFRTTSTYSPENKDIAASQVAHAPAQKAAATDTAQMPVATDTLHDGALVTLDKDALDNNTADNGVTSNDYYEPKRKSAAPAKSKAAGPKPDSSTLAFSKVSATADREFYYSPAEPAKKEAAPPVASMSAGDLNKLLNGRAAGVNVTKVKKDSIAIGQNNSFFGAQPGRSQDVAANNNFNNSADKKDKALAKEYKVNIRGYMNPQVLNTFNGQVLDNSNKPVAGAVIKIPGQRQYFVATDSLGKFTIQAKDSALKVSIASVGFQQRDYTLRNRLASYDPAANQIVLQQNRQSLDEVVVIGYGTQKKKDVTGSVSTVRGEEIKEKSASPAAAFGKKDMSIHVLDAEPVVGWDEYNNYLEKNKKLPDSAAAVHGMVVVRFNVTNKGTLKNFSIEKSLNEALDLEAIRLVKEGPAWRLLKGRKAKASVMVNF
jgi:TonB family protein